MCDVVKSVSQRTEWGVMWEECRRQDLVVQRFGRSVSKSGAQRYACMKGCAQSPLPSML